MTTLEHPTFDDVWRMFQETERRSQETERMFQETERRFQESDRRFQETERLFKERDAQSRAKTDLILSQLSKQLGELGNRLGEFVEHMVAPAVVRLFQAEGIEVHEVYPEAASHRDGEDIEIDLLVVNDGTLIAVECKSKLTQEHVDDHLQRMQKLKRLFPLYKNHQALGAVAAMVMSDSVKNYAQKQGLYVLCQNGECVEIGNSPTFKPKVW
jgi:hypothetical protein